MDRARRGLPSCENGAMGLVAAIVFPTVTFAIFAGLEFARLVEHQQNAQAAVDAAAVSAMVASISDASRETAARDTFWGNYLGVSDEPRDDQRLAVRLDTKSGDPRITVTYTSGMKTTVAGLIGLNTLEYRAEATAVGGKRKYVDISILLDASDSMGLPSTPEGRERMKVASKVNCEFACHVQRPEQTYLDAFGNRQPEPNLLDVARAEGIELRVDVARAGALDFIDLAEDAGKDNVAVSISVDAFSNRLISMVHRTKDLDLARQSLAGFELGYGEKGKAYTRLSGVTRPPGIVGSFLERKPPDVPDRYVLIVTDGLEDNGNTFKPGISTFTLANSKCDRFREKGYRVAVILTKYLEVKKPAKGEDQTSWIPFSGDVLPIYPDIEPDAKACADPGLFAMADSPEEIREAFATMFQNIIYAPYISQ